MSQIGFTHHLFFLSTVLSQRFNNIIRHYKSWKADHPDTWVEYSASQNSLENAIEAAALSHDEAGRKHPHQYRLQNQHLQQYALSLLQHVAAIRNVENFHQLIGITDGARVHGIGVLAVYDVAVRIGAFLNIYPEHVYLHAGAKTGAKGILGDLQSNIINKDDLPEAFRTDDLSCYELEDILCIYKAIFIRRKL